MSLSDFSSLSGAWLKVFVADAASDVAGHIPTTHYLIARPVDEFIRLTIKQLPLRIGGQTGLQLSADGIDLSIIELVGQPPVAGQRCTAILHLAYGVDDGIDYWAEISCEVEVVGIHRSASRLKVNLRDMASARFDLLKGLPIATLARELGTLADWSVPYHGLKDGDYTAGWYAAQDDPSTSPLVQFPLQALETFGTGPLDRYLVSKSGYAQRLPAFSLLKLLDKLATLIGYPLGAGWQDQPNLQDAYLLGDAPDATAWNWGRLGQFTAAQTDATAISLVQDLELAQVVTQTANTPDRIDYRVPVTTTYDLTAELTISNTHPTDTLLGTLGIYGLYEGMGWNANQAQQAINLAPGSSATYLINESWVLERDLKVIISASLSHANTTWTMTSSLVPQWAETLDLRAFLPGLTLEQLVSQAAALCFAQFEPQGQTDSSHLALRPILRAGTTPTEAVLRLPTADIWHTGTSTQVTTALLNGATTLSSGLLTGPIAVTELRLNAASQVDVLIEGLASVNYRFAVAANNQQPLGSRNYLVKWMGFVIEPGGTLPERVQTADGTGTTGYVIPYSITEWPEWFTSYTQPYQWTAGRAETIELTQQLLTSLTGVGPNWLLHDHTYYNLNGLAFVLEVSYQVTATGTLALVLLE